MAIRTTKLIVRLMILATLLTLASAPVAGPSLAADNNKPAAEIVAQVGHAGGTLGLAYSPDGRHFVTGGFSDYSVKLWDAASGRLLRTFAGHDGGVRSLAVSVDSRLIVSTAAQTVRLWDALTGRLIHAFEGHSDELRSVAISPDALMVLSGGDDMTVRAWDAASGKQLYRLDGKAAVLAVAHSLDGSQIVVGRQDGSITLAGAKDGRTIKTASLRTKGIGHISFSRDLSRLVAEQDGAKAIVFDLKAARTLRSIDLPGLQNVTMSPDGSQILAECTDEEIDLYDANSGEHLRTLGKLDNQVYSIAFSPDGKFALAGDFDSKVRQWHTETGEVRNDYVPPTSIEQVALTPDATRFATVDGSKASGHQIKLWDGTSGRLIRTLEGHDNQIWALAISPDGSRIASGGLDETIRIWETASGKLLTTISGHVGSVKQISFSWDGRVIAAGGFGSAMIGVWDVAAGKPLRDFRSDNGTKPAVAISPSNNWLAAADKAGVNVWDLETGALIKSLPRASAHFESLAFSPDGGRLIAGGLKIALWDLSTEKPIQLETAPIVEKTSSTVASAPSVGFSADGKHAFAGGGEVVVAVWNAHTGALMRAFTRTGSTMPTMAFAPDKNRALSGGYDGAIRLWDMLTGAEVLTIAGGSDNWTSITPSGFFTRSGRGAAKIAIVRGFEVTGRRGGRGRACRRPRADPRERPGAASRCRTAGRGRLR
jgi:WD40 repeat protein